MIRLLKSSYRDRRGEIGTYKWYQSLTLLAKNFSKNEDLQDLKRSKGALARIEKALKEKMEAQKKDLSRLQEDLSVKCCHYRDAKDKIQDLSDEIEKLKAKYNDAEFSFKKFESSSQILNNMLDQQLHKNDKGELEKEEANEKHMTYGPKIVSENVETRTTKETNSAGKDVSVTNVSKTSAEEVKDAEVKPSTSKFIPSVFQSHASRSIKSYLSAQSTPYFPQQCQERRCHGFTNQNHFRNDRSCYFQRLTCGSNSPVYAPFPKKQTCFACGKPSHIARNCIHQTTKFYQKVTPKIKVCSNPRKVERPKNLNDLKQIINRMVLE
ncbi:hypothetical protein R6Q59_029667 [Mikania micrantha]